MSALIGNTEQQIKDLLGGNISNGLGLVDCPFCSTMFSVFPLLGVEIFILSNNSEDEYIFSYDLDMFSISHLDGSDLRTGYVTVFGQPTAYIGAVNPLVSSQLEIFSSQSSVEIKSVILDKDGANNPIYSLANWPNVPLAPIIITIYESHI